MSVVQESRAPEREAPEFGRPFVWIQPSSGWVALKLAELWEYRELLYFLAWRDVKVRYKQTLLGVGWAILQPLATALVFSLFFGRLGKIPADGRPYLLFAYAALVPWTFFSYSLTQSANSLVTNTALVTKVYFPRLVIPVATTLGGLVDLVLAFAVLSGMMAVYGQAPGEQLLALPAFVLLAFTCALGVGVWLSALNVQFRDVRYVIPFLSQFWLFATPVAYPASLLGEPWRTLYGVNPMVGVIDGFRWSLLGTPLDVTTLAVSAATAFAVAVAGAFFFRRMERRFADIV